MDSTSLIEDQSLLDTSDNLLDQTNASDTDSTSQKSLQSDIDHTPSEDEKWSTRSPAPETMCALYGTVAVHGNTAYLSRYYNIFSYSLSKDKWCQLKPSTYQNFSLAVLEDSIVTIGGISREGKRTKNLYRQSKGRWRVCYSPMPDHRVCAASLATPTHLVVVGGRNRQELDSADIMEIATSQWHSLAQCLPDRMGHPQITLCNDSLYIGKDTSIYSTSLAHLIDASLKSEIPKWENVKELPSHMGGASLVAMNGRIIALGGHDCNDKPAEDICSFHEEDESWTTIDSLPMPKRDVLTALLPGNLLLIVGGWSEAQFYDTTNIARLSIC